MHIIKLLTIPLASVIISSCVSVTDRTLSPPSDTKWVTVEVKNPSPYTKPFPLEVRYISHKCQKKRVSGFDGSVITEPGYNGLKVPLQQQGSSDIWLAKVAMTGGGSCEWTLSAMNLGIEYIDATHLGKDLVPGTAVGVVIAFDNDSSRSSQFDSVKTNDLFLSPDYYPLIKKNKMIRKVDSLSLFGAEDFMQKKITQIYDGVKIKFYPKINESKLVRMVAPEKHQRGEFYKIIYPDGNVISDGSTHPDVKKLVK
ncbi:hypothetical protein ABEH87_12435 [Erwinia sp. Eh17-17]|uniref:hypothetical protein n=1 Tax=Erwinia sp. Eh17-17 TaxID=3080330 RepID=UPI00320BA5E8